jgi:UTP-glucose-1-phosphate uridylyltransferase
MGFFSKDNQKGRDKAFETLISEFTENTKTMVEQDNKRKKAVILIAVEENEDGSNAHVDIVAAGTEEKLIYGLSTFAEKPGTHELFNKAVDFISFISFSKIFGK